MNTVAWFRCDTNLGEAAADWQSGDPIDGACKTNPDLSMPDLVNESWVGIFTSGCPSWTAASRFVQDPHPVCVDNRQGRATSGDVIGCVALDDQWCFHKAVYDISWATCYARTTSPTDCNSELHLYAARWNV